MLTTLAVIAAALTLAATGAMTGLFFAFSVAVMPGLDTLTPERAVAAMRQINRAILNPLFLATFAGTPLAAALTTGLLLLDGATRAGTLAALAAVAYLCGTILPTAIVNVPLNNALDAAPGALDPAEAARRWAAYFPRWTRWNRLHALASALSLLLVGLALFAWGGHW